MAAFIKHGPFLINLDNVNVIYYNEEDEAVTFTFGSAGVHEELVKDDDDEDVSVTKRVMDQLHLSREDGGKQLHDSMIRALGGSPIVTG